MKKKVFLGILLIFLIALVPLFALKDAKFGGSDDAGSQVVEEVDSSYEPWATPILERLIGGELPGEVESLFFCIQTADPDCRCSPYRYDAFRGFQSGSGETGNRYPFVYAEQRHSGLYHPGAGKPGAAGGNRSPSLYQGCRKQCIYRKYRRLQL